MKKKTNEERGKYATEKEDSLNNARAMMGWDHEPAIVIERPRVIAERQPNGEFIERTTPVYVKYSTTFKDELKGITGSELKVWTYIILSIDENGTAFPGIRTIAEAVGVSHQTVITAVEGLEKKNLLHVMRGEKRYNIYQPSDEYVGIFSKDPMSQKIRPVKKEEQTSQVSSPDESNRLDLNKNINKNKEAANAAALDLSIENQIFLGKDKVTQSKADTIKNALRQYFKLTPRWSSKFDSQWLKWAMDEGMTPSQIQAAAAKWRSDKRFNWGVPSLKGIAEHWLELIDSPASHEFTRPEHQRYVPQEGRYVPNPNRR